MKKNLKAVFLFYITLLFICFLIGYMYGFNNVFKINLGNDLIYSFKFVDFYNILLEVAIISISFLLSFIFIGNVLFILYLSFKFFSTGYITQAFISCYGLIGVFFSLIYFLIFLIFYILLFILFVYIIQLSKFFLNSFIFKREFNQKNFLNLIYRISTIFVFFITYNFLIYFFQKYLINFFILLL